ncbi:hypothetical protein Tco_1233270 [Tanacetum coccineum]
MNEYKGRMPTKIELTLEQSQQGVSNDVLNIRVILKVFTVKMEILLEPTLNKLLIDVPVMKTSKYGKSNTSVLKDAMLCAGNLSRRFFEST